MDWNKPIETKERTIEDCFGGLCVYQLIQARNEIIKAANFKGKYTNDFSVIDEETKNKILKSAISAVFDI